MAEIRCPLDPFDVRHTHLVDNSLSTQVIEEELLISCYKDLAKWCGEDHINLC